MKEVYFVLLDDARLSVHGWKVVFTADTSAECSAFIAGYRH